MLREERIRLFRNWLEENSDAKARLPQGTGISNSPTVVELGLELIDADLKSGGAPPEYVFWGAIGVPPRHEVYIAAHVIGDNAKALTARLVQMATLGAT